MVVVAPRSAKLVEARGARFTLLCGYVFLFVAFLWMLLVWNEGSPYWQIAARVHLHRRRRRARRHAGVALADRLGAGDARRHGVGHGRPPARPRRRDHAVDLRRAPHGRLRVGRLGRRSPRRTRASPTRRRRSSRSRSPAPRRSRSSTRSTPTRSSPARSRRSSTATTGRTRPASSRSSSAPCSSSSCSRSTTRRSGCSPSVPRAGHDQPSAVHDLERRASGSAATCGRACG